MMIMSKELMLSSILSLVWMVVNVDDFLGGWCQRKKNDFTFKYSYLEDEKL